MILVVDAGNTNIVLGLYKEDELLHQWRIGTERTATVDEYAMIINQLLRYVEVDEKEINGMIISSVVPQLTFVLEGYGQQYLKQTPLIVGPGIKTGLNIRYENPREVGADRIVNAVAAIHLYGPPLIVVDFGTATTFEYIDENGQYIGGAIAPGIAISMEALYQRAAKLPRVELEPATPKSVIGRNPVSSMQSGLVFGFAGQVDGIVERIYEEFGNDAKVIATGGMAGYISSHSKTIQIVNPHLTLQGLKIIYDLNRGRNSAS